MLQLLDLPLQVTHRSVLGVHDLLHLDRVHFKLRGPVPEFIDQRSRRSRLHFNHCRLVRRFGRPLSVLQLQEGFLFLQSLILLVRLRFLPRVLLSGQVHCRLGQLHALGTQLLLHITDVGLGPPRRLFLCVDRGLHSLRKVLSALLGRRDFLLRRLHCTLPQLPLVLQLRPQQLDRVLYGTLHFLAFGGEHVILGFQGRLHDGNLLEVISRLLLQLHRLSFVGPHLLRCFLLRV